MAHVTAETVRVFRGGKRRRLTIASAYNDAARVMVLASALEAPPRVADRTAGFDQPGREYTAGDALGLRRDR